jgi:L-sorbose 1-phosphate reductase
MGKFSDYIKANHGIPKTTLAWRIYGKGMEYFGDDKGLGKKVPVELPIPEPKDDELLVRNDAVGLCFSDTKIIKFGSEHPRITGRDLKKDPVTPGHEVAVTVIKAGKQRAKNYKPGQRFIVQADAFYKGKSMSYGYNLPGGLTQYGIIPKEILDGDAGSYLIPIENDKVGYSEVALVEPWACVVAA